MVGAAWKQDPRGKGIYVDHDVEESQDDYVYDSSRGNWAELPDLVIERIYSYLNAERKYYCSLVCRRWYDAFHLSYSWNTLVFADRVLVRRRFNYHLGWQYTIDHYRSSIYLHKMAKHIRHLIFEPMLNFYNLGEMLTMLYQYGDRFPGNLSHIQTLKYTFNCDLASRAENAIYGTGGQLLGCLKKLMYHLHGLTYLELTNLLLDGTEAMYALDEVCYNSCETLTSLSLINLTKRPCHLLHPGVFVNLRTLHISPQSLSSNLLWLLAFTRLKHLHIVENAYTESSYPLEPRAWLDMQKSNPKIRVHMKGTGKMRRDLMWQEAAPVCSITYNSPYSRVTMTSVLPIVDFYRDRLKVYSHVGLPRFHASKSFQERADTALVTLVRECTNLHTLVIRERISTATLLLIASTGKSLKRLYVRKNALVLKADWPKSLDWTEDYYKWLKTAARSYQVTEEEVARELDQPEWHAMSDQEFKALKINVEYEA